MTLGQQPTDNFIRITHDEANSEHVESLLRRQMSLRGERGITAVRKRRWYYQNWFLLMITAGLAAFVAWSLIEPYFDDLIYVQGKIVTMNDSQSVRSEFGEGESALRLTIPGRGWIRIGEQHIWFLESTKLYSNGKVKDFDPSELKVGQEVGVHLEYLQAGHDGLALGLYVDPAPPAAAASSAPMSLAQLNAQHSAASIVLFPLVAGMIGLAVGALDGIICRMPRRALFSGAVGLLIGVLGGFVSSFLAGLVYAPLNHLAINQSGPGSSQMSTFAFFVQMTGRGLAWLLAGVAMGLGQGIALRSKRLLLYGLVGGIVGGLLGGLLFDPIDLLLLGVEKPSAHIARMIGLTVIGLFVGAMIGVVELLARDAWLRMTEGPLAGKEFLLFKDTMRIGSSSRSDIYLFNDPQVAAQHATIRTMGDQSEIDSNGTESMVLVNARPVRHARLRHGDQITIGRTSFLFQSRKG